MSNLNNVYSQLTDDHTKVSTGKAFQKPSEDPIRALQSMDITRDLERMEQYEQNIDRAKSQLMESENALSSISDSLVEVKTVLQKAMNGTTNDENRKSMAQVVISVKDNIMNLLNSEYGGSYLFGGYNTASAPFSSEGYNGQVLETMGDAEATELNSQLIQVKTGRSTDMAVSLPGLEVTGYGADNLLSLLDDIQQSLTNGDDLSVLEDQMKKIDGYFDRVERLVPSVGSRVSNLEVMEVQSTDSQYSLTSYLSNLEDVDIEQAIIDFKTTEMVYNAALAVGAKIIQPTLVDFLR
jgi:flagellar hook-associated protein 3 FlgL